MMRMALFCGVLTAMFCPTAVTQDGGELAGRVAKVDSKLLTALSELAVHFDSKKDPEAAHFFCECAIGFGSTEEKIKALKKKWEDEVYYGRSRGGIVLGDVKVIDEKLQGLAKEYRGTFDELVKAAGKRKLADDERVLLHRVAAKFELTRSAGEYIQATQRFNELRSKLKLRAVLWDFEASRKLILAGWYMSETGDYLSAEKSDESELSYSEAVAFSKENAVRAPNTEDLRGHADLLRALCLSREDLLNPDVRRIWLGRWGKGAKLKGLTAYRIPRETYRPDIVTPSARSHETVAEDRDRWVDIEESLSLKAGGKALISRYPYEGEPNAPSVFGDGENWEHGWQDEGVERKGQTSFGLPIMLRFFGAKALADVDYEVKKKGGYAVSCKKYLNGDKRVDLEDLPTIVLLPEKPLDKGTTYSVKITGKLDGTPFEKKWEFTTRDK